MQKPTTRFIVLVSVLAILSVILIYNYSGGLAALSFRANIASASCTEKNISQAYLKAYANLSAEPDKTPFTLEEVKELEKFYSSSKAKGKWDCSAKISTAVFSGTVDSVLKTIDALPKQSGKALSPSRSLTGNIPITHCDGYPSVYLNQPDTTYVLQSDITQVEAYTCLSVAGNNITLDLNGHKMIGGGVKGFGLDVSSSTGFTLKNGELTRFEEAARIAGSQNSLIQNVKFTNNNYGLAFYAGSSNTISGCEFFSNMYGMWTPSSTGISFVNTKFEENMQGIFNGEGNSFINVQQNHNLKSNMISLTNTGRAYPKDQAVNLNFSLKNPDGTVASNFTYDVAIYPQTSYQATPSGSNLSVNFVPDKNGVYTVALGITTPSGNSVARNYMLLIGDTTLASATRYYMHGEIPVHGQLQLNGPADSGSMFSYPTSTYEERHCGAWVEFVPDEIVNQYFIIKDVAIGLYLKGGGTFRVLQYAVTDSSSEEYTTTFQAPADYSFVTFSVNNMNIFADYAWRSYWAGLKIVGDKPSIVSDSVHQSYADFSYLYAGPKINLFSSAPGSDIRKIRLLSSTFDSPTNDSASLVMEGEGSADVVIDMQDTTKTYGVFCDGTFAHGNSICTINNKDNGVMNVTIALGSTHLLRIMPVTYDAADFNEDGIVDQTDYTIWYGHYGMNGADKADGDANDDNIVDQRDFTTWYNHYGQAL